MHTQTTQQKKAAGSAESSGVSPLVLAIHCALKTGMELPCHAAVTAMGVAPADGANLLVYLSERLEAPLEIDPTNDICRYSDLAFEIPPVTLSVTAAVSLVVAYASLLRLQRLTITTDVSSIVDVVQPFLPASVCIDADSLLPSPRLDGESDIVVSHLLNICARGVERQQTLAIAGRAMTAHEPTRTDFDAYGLAWVGSAWFVAGLSHSTNKVCVLALHEIDKLTLTGLSYVSPVDLDVDSLFHHLGGTVRHGKLHEVILQVDAEEAWRIPPRVWKYCHRICQVSRRDVILTMHTTLAPSLRQWILSCGRHVRVLAPASLKADIWAEFAAAARAYGIGDPVAQKSAEAAPQQPAVDVVPTAPPSPLYSVGGDNPKNPSMDPEWREWATRNLVRGCHPERILHDLLCRRYSLAEIRRTMGRQFPEYFFHQVDYRALAEIPTSRLLQLPGAERIDTDMLQLFVIEDFLTAGECRHLIELASRKLVPSAVTSSKAGHRTSQTCYLPDVDHPIVGEIDSRISSALGISLSYSEDMQAQQYAVGEEFKTHTDWFVPGGDAYRKCGAELGNRTWTFMIYLDNTLQGGGTHFDQLGRTFYPKTGRAVAWNNLLPDGGPNWETSHQGLPVEAGEKNIITKWFRENGSGAMFLSG